MNMRLLPIALALLLSAGDVLAGPAIDAAGQCLTDNTSGRDRKDLVKWIFLAIARHPEIRDLAIADAEIERQTNEKVGALFTRLIAEDCADEMQAMVRESGPSAISNAFEVLGRVAMQELMVHPDVSAAFSGLDQYVDGARINEALKPAQ